MAKSSLGKCQGSIWHHHNHQPSSFSTTTILHDDPPPPHHCCPRLPPRTMVVNRPPPPPHHTLTTPPWCHVTGHSKQLAQCHVAVTTWHTTIVNCPPLWHTLTTSNDKNDTVTPHHHSNRWAAASSMPWHLMVTTYAVVAVHSSNDDNEWRWLGSEGGERATKGQHTPIPSFYWQNPTQPLSPIACTNHRHITPSLITVVTPLCHFRGCCDDTTTQRRQHTTMMMMTTHNDNMTWWRMMMMWCDTVANDDGDDNDDIVLITYSIY